MLGKLVTNQIIHGQLIQQPALIAMPKVCQQSLPKKPSFYRFMATPYQFSQPDKSKDIACSNGINPNQRIIQQTSLENTYTGDSSHHLLLRNINHSSNATSDTSKGWTKSWLTPYQNFWKLWRYPRITRLTWLHPF